MQLLGNVKAFNNEQSNRLMFELSTIRLIAFEGVAHYKGENFHKILDYYILELLWFLLFQKNSPTTILFV